MNEIMDRADEDEGVLAGPDVQVNSLFFVICKFGKIRKPRNSWDPVPNTDSWSGLGKGSGFRVENLKIRVSGRVPGCAPGSGTRRKPGYKLCFLQT